jgi:hypothetical protein
MFPVPIGDFEQLLGVIVVMSAVVNLQFHTEKTFALSIQDRDGLIAIFTDGAAVLFVAVEAEIISIGIIAVVVMHDSVAVVAAGVMIVIAALAQKMVTVCDGVLAVDVTAAAVTAAALVLIAR